MKLSIIIVSFNTSSLLEECLSSLFSDLESTHLAKLSEVIVIDNASIDESVNMIQKKFPHVNLVRNRKNVGFAYANNQGIGLSKGKYVLLLNSDTIVQSGAIEILLNAMEQDPNIGVSGPKLLNCDGSIQPSFGFFPSIGRIAAWMFFWDDIPFISSFFTSYHTESLTMYTDKRSVDWVTGACMIVSKDAIAHAGVFDDAIFMYGEEVEWCYRIKRAGYAIKYIPDSQIIHLRGASAENISVAGIAEEFFFIQYFFQKHKPNWQLPVIKGILQAGALLRIIIFGIIGKHRERIPIYAKALHMAR